MNPDAVLLAQSALITAIRLALMVKVIVLMIYLGFYCEVGAIWAVLLKKQENIEVNAQRKRYLVEIIPLKMLLFCIIGGSWGVATGYRGNCTDFSTVSTHN